jgi:hypothetical protein
MPVPAALEHLVGLQAQGPDAPYVALWSRLEDFAADQLATALLDRRAVRTPLMRATLHLLGGDCLALRPVLKPAHGTVNEDGAGRCSRARAAEALCGCPR